MSRIFAFIDARTGLFTRWNQNLSHNVEGPSLGRALLPAIAAVFGLAALTGVGLMCWYAPSTTDAWPSVWHIVNDVPLGDLIRSIHHSSVSALLVLVGLALAHGIVTAAYRKPRELGWLGLIGIVGILPLFPMTGNLFPWDESGYWRTAIEATIAGNIPLIGNVAKTALIGGAEVGNSTLTRYYALHTIVAPILFFLVLKLAWSARRRSAAAAEVAASGNQISYFPKQYFVELFIASLAVVGVVLLAKFLPTPLDAPADPNRALDARPEWYFMPLFAIRHALQGPYEALGTVVVPGLIVGFIATMPWLDPKGTRRWAMAGVLVAIVSVLGYLTVDLMGKDAKNEELQKDKAAVTLRAELAKQYALLPESEPEVDGTVPLFAGYSVFLRERCLECHATVASVPAVSKGTDLRGYLSRPWIKRFLENPDIPEHFGGTKLETAMPGFKELGNEKLDALVEFMVSQGGRAEVNAKLVETGKKLFEDEGCSGCHDMAAGESSGPHLDGYGSVAWISELIANPSHPTMYGENGSGMAAYGHIPPRERELIAKWLIRQGLDSQVGTLPPPHAGVTAPP